MFRYQEAYRVKDRLENRSGASQLELFENGVDEMEVFKVEHHYRVKKILVNFDVLEKRSEELVIGRTTIEDHEFNINSCVVFDAVQD